MTTFRSVKAALEGALAAGVGMLDPQAATRWENRAFMPIADVPYQRVDFIPVEPENPTFGDSFYREAGIMQVSLCYPGNAGAGDALAQAELLRALFKRGATFTSGGVTVVIQRTPEICPAFDDGDRYVVPVRIRYFTVN